MSNNISETRRANLLLLKKEFEQIFQTFTENKNKVYTKKMFADDIGISASEYSQLFNTKYKRKFSEYFARRIEKNANIKPFWLDVVHDVKTGISCINVTAFLVGIKSYNLFLEQGIVDNNNSELLESIKVKLFSYLVKNQDYLDAKSMISTSVFLDFIKP